MPNNVIKIRKKEGIEFYVLFRVFFPFQCGLATPRPGCHGPRLHMSSTMWYIMQSIQSKYSLSERLIRTIAAIRSFPHDNVEDLIRKVSAT